MSEEPPLPRRKSVLAACAACLCLRAAPGPFRRLGPCREAATVGRSEEPPLLRRELLDGEAREYTGAIR